MNVTEHAQTTPTGPARHRFSINITPVERVGRIVAGVAAIVAAIVAAVVLLASAASGLAVVLEILLAAAGVDLAVTGAMGHCPLYQKLGYEPKALRRPS